MMQCCDGPPRGEAAPGFEVWARWVAPPAISPTTSDALHTHRVAVDLAQQFV